MSQSVHHMLRLSITFDWRTNEARFCVSRSRLARQHDGLGSFERLLHILARFKQVAISIEGQRDRCVSHHRLNSLFGE